MIISYCCVIVNTEAKKLQPWLIQAAVKAQRPEGTAAYITRKPGGGFMKINGMMCGHCEARVKKTLEALPQVEEAIVSHESGTAVVKLNAEVDPAVLKKAVEEQDYEVTDIQ